MDNAAVRTNARIEESIEAHDISPYNLLTETNVGFGAQQRNRPAMTTEGAVEETDTAPDTIGDAVLNTEVGNMALILAEEEEKGGEAIGVDSCAL